MLFRKYHIVIFKEGRSGSRNLRLRSWFFVLLVVLGLSLVSSHVWLLRAWMQGRGLQTELDDARRVIEDQRRQFDNLTGQVTQISRDLVRVHRFDDKLRLMMNMEKDPAEVGDEPGDFAASYLPLHRQQLAVRKMRAFLDSLSGQVRLEEVRQQDLLRVLRERRDILVTLPSIWPVTGFISSSFGERTSPFGGGVQFHKGLDITSRAGTPVVATADDTITLAGPDGAYGNSIEIDHGGGIITKYGHLRRYLVRANQWVKRGEIIGHVGSTGRTTGPHLHYEVRLNGVPVNPMRYILE